MSWTDLLTSGQLSGRPGYPDIYQLCRWRAAGFGPKFIQIGGRIFYPLEDVEAWERKSASTDLAPLPSGKGSLLLTSNELSQRPRWPHQSVLSRWRDSGYGPAWQRIGARFFYRLDVVEAWESEHIDELGNFKSPGKPGRRRQLVVAEQIAAAAE